MHNETDIQLCLHEGSWPGRHSEDCPIGKIEVFHDLHDYEAITLGNSDDQDRPLTDFLHGKFLD